MKCRVCGREIGDEEQFCKYCGSEQKRKRKRLTWGERKRKNEAETKGFIAKASLQAEEVKEAAEESSASVRAVFVESAEKYYRKSVALTALFALLTVAAFAALVLIRFAEMNDTLTIVIAFALLIVAAYCAASFAERLYAARSLSAMRKSGRGIKKLRYAHPPVMLCDGKIYRLEPTEKCPVCGAERHLSRCGGGTQGFCTDRARRPGRELLRPLRNLPSGDAGVCAGPGDHLPERGRGGAGLYPAAAAAPQLRAGGSGAVGEN